MRLISVEKDWKHVLMQNSVTLNICCDICLPDIPVSTHHNQFFSEPLMTTLNWLFSEPPTFERTQQTFSQMKKFCSSQVSVVTFSSGVGKWITVCFLLTPQPVLFRATDDKPVL